MKFVLTYTIRTRGSAGEFVSSAEAAQKLLSNWTPNAAATMREWVERCDGGGGFAVIQTDDLGALHKDLATWAPWLEFQVYPVLDMAEATPLSNEALAVARSVV